MRSHSSTAFATPSLTVVPEKLLKLRSSKRDSVLLELETALVGDRFATQIFFVEGNTRTPVLQSIEGDDRDLWPPSPPLQEVVPQSNDQIGDYLAGIGRAGKSTWSVIIATVNLDSGETGFEFDFACRVTTPWDRLSSTWKTNGEATGESKSELRGDPQQPGNTVTLISNEYQIQGRLIDGVLAMPTGEEIAFAAAQDANAALPTSVRWKFQWLLSSAP